VRQQPDTAGIMTASVANAVGKGLSPAKTGAAPAM
jgi:hypothetical protein